MTAPAGDNIQRSNYWTLGLVGQGQFGQVYCAVHRKTNQLVALKHINRERLPTHLFLRELRFLLSLEHPHLVSCHTLEHTATGRQLVLDYCEGGTLRSIMEQEIQLSLQEILTLTEAVLSALEHAHSQGIVHCDIKPENILLSLTPDGWWPKVSDFGIARLRQDLDKTYTGATGSPAYMAPERFYAQHAEASDLYAVSIVLYELLLGERPFSGSHQQLMQAHLNYVVEIPETLPADLRSLLTKGLQKLMARRFQTAHEMKAAILKMGQTLSPKQLAERFPKPLSTIAVTRFCAQEHIPLQKAGADCLLAVANTLGSMPVLATNNTVYGWPVSQNDGLTGPTYSNQWFFPSPVQQLLVGENGAIAATHRAIYQLRPQTPPLTLATFPEPVVVTPGNHRWLIAYGSRAPQSCWLIDTLGQVPLKPRPFIVKVPQGKRHVLLLGDRYLVLADGVDQATRLQIYTRWGKPLGHLSLNASVHQIKNSRAPYQFLAQSGTHQRDLLIVTLKPFRVVRCRLDICPKWLGELIIGTVAISAAGQLQVVNFQGQIIGQVDHLPPPMAISFCYPYHIWLVAQEYNGPQLHRIDIRSLDLDIVF